MNKKFIYIISCITAMTMIVSSCTSPANDLMKGYVSKVDVSSLEPIDENLKEAILNFSWNMFKENSQNTGNLMISPVSIYTALAMTLNGADGDTKAAMLEALSAKGITEEDLNAGMKSWISSLTNDDRIAKLNVANSIWYRNSFEADEKFLQKNADYYSASIKKLDFSKEDSVNTINDWVKDSTNGTIDKIIDNINDDTMMYLINAIYFKGDWKDQFKANNTYKQPFNSPTDVIDTDFMHRRGDIGYLNGDGVTGVILPYLDEQFAFIALLPEEGKTTRELIDNFSALNLIKLLENKKNANIDLSLPKFEGKYEDSLNDELAKLGMDIAFDPNLADFSLMSKSHKRELFINNVKHKTFIRVDEKGTEAAAVTSVEMNVTGMPMDVQKVVFDRPFIYGIIDVTTGIPLFMGVLENPDAE
ncbi:serpin B [Sedimentibacter acidaminivorans]|uniref:Serpin B n=1 Tax=Sedimentibacter acidaminivorans TaxID=913099 RepID=A0ABS4GBM6_9FIRM|nr:serpin family protein [Sedimentibacter acidaminivorans]MBP1925094.1 serpin B [Sedimentibacter acidaminivorans]